MNNKESKRTSFFGLLTRMDYLALLLQALLLGIGIFFIYSTGSKNGGDLEVLWKRQLVWVGIGFIVYFVLAWADYRLLAAKSWLFYSFGMLLLLLVLFFGREVNNARSWLPIPGLGMIQPSELVKPLVLLFMGWAATIRDLRYSKIPLWLPIALIALVPVILIALQPDFGTAIVFLPLGAVIIFITGLKKRWITAIICCGIILIPVVFIHLRPHQQERVKVFIEAPSRSLFAVIAPKVTPEASETMQNYLNAFLETDKNRPRNDWNARQALHAVGSGGLTGKGLGRGTQHSLGFLPKNVAPTDFIFSVIAEETGFLGGITVLALLTGIFLCFCRTALSARNALGCCLAVGAGCIVAVHTLINVGMNVQAMPIIGIPLPFVSYGGSFVLGIMAIGGLVQSVHIRRKNIENTESQEQ